MMLQLIQYWSPEAIIYLLDVINEALERLPEEQQFFRANRTLENILKTIVSVFARTRSEGNTRRALINKEDLKKAYKMIISQDIQDVNVLNEIENSNEKNNQSNTTINPDKSKRIREYDLKKQLIKSTYCKDGTHNTFIYEYDPQTRNKIKYTQYQPDGIKLDYIEDFDPKTRKKTKHTQYKANGERDCIKEYDHKQEK
ncbi:hypothetical protein fragment [Candidatus Phytoplasma australiense]|uniref:DUF2963 domain-containing protein n=1 Tax=Phytoplasma australiense TaxID=59748 RepID=B1VB44_PHYAS|nr:hypothetical protein fragment [Candidatus Phytoplasma australiense]